MLHIYEDYTSPPFSQGDLTNPLIVCLDAENEAISVQKLLLHNDDPLKVYRSISVQVPSIQIPTGWTVKLLCQSRIPTAADWLTVSSANLAAVPDILDLNYYALWIQIRVPGGTMAETITGPRLLLNYTEQPS